MIFFEFLDICKDFFEIIYPGMKYDFLKEESSNLIEELV